jgi:parallel beta-helix repeat protein
MKKELFCFLGCMLMVLTTVVPISATTSLTKPSKPLNMGNILYVGGTGSNNYTKIQDAINDAVNRDTVFVYDESSPYQEILTINKSISLIGENKETTIIETLMENTTVVTISTDNVSMNGFTILMMPSEGWNLGVIISKMEAWPGETLIIQNVRIFNNNIIGFAEQSAGIDCLYLNYGNISNNTINCEWAGIILHLSSYNTISKNIIEYNHRGIDVENTWNPRYHLWFTHPQFGSNIISGNTIRNNSVGIDINGDRTTNDKILENNIIDNNEGIILYTTLKTEIARNNFLGNNRSAAIRTGNLFFYPTNSWHDNYWDNPKKFPVPILGAFWFLVMYNTDFEETNSGTGISLGTYPVIAFDRTPAQEAYTIPGMN